MLAELIEIFKIYSTVVKTHIGEIKTNFFFS